MKAPAGARWNAGPLGSDRPTALFLMTLPGAALFYGELCAPATCSASYAFAPRFRVDEPDLARRRLFIVAATSRSAAGQAVPARHHNNSVTSTCPQDPSPFGRSPSSPGADDWRLCRRSTGFVLVFGVVDADPYAPIASISASGVVAVAGFSARLRTPGFHGVLVVNSSLPRRYCWP